MKERLITLIASAGLVIGAILGMVGSFVSSASVRGLAWGIDGVALILAGAFLTVYYFRKGFDITAAGFLIFTVGEGFILAYSGILPEENISTFGTGTGLWAVSLSIISSQTIFPFFVRSTGFIAAILFAIVSVLIYSGHPYNALTQPLPFYAYPFFAITILGWAFTLFR